MKKFTILLFFLICLSFNIVTITPASTTNVFKEGVYKVSDFNFSQDNLYTVQNISSEKGVYLLIFDENQVGLQYIRLKPKSIKYNLVPLKPDYRLVILGDGEAFIS